VRGAELTLREDLTLSRLQTITRFHRTTVMRQLFVGLACFFVFVAVSSGAEREFLSGYAGSLPKESHDKARTYFNMPAVRALLARLESGPATEAEVVGALAGSDATLGDLVRLRLLRQEGDRYAIGFAYFTASDMRTVYAVADRVAPSLAAAYVAHRKEFDRIFAAYPARSVPRSQIAFVLLTGFCLNWDGLHVTKDLGYRKPVFVDGPEFHYSFWASEEVPGRDYHGVIWGSSTFPAETYSFSSFGDPDSDPRFNFPDLFYLDAAAVPQPLRKRMESVGLQPNTEFGEPGQHVLGDLRNPVAAILVALRDGPRSASALAKEVDRDARPLLDLLEEIDYIRRDRQNRFTLHVPVFTEADRPMIDRTIELSRRIMRTWLAAHDGELRRDLSSLTGIRAGLPFEALFTQVWHEIFGEVTRELISSKLVANPYAPAARSKGSFSAVWRTSLYKLTLG
jgi:hypothetical protein